MGGILEYTIPDLADICGVFKSRSMVVEQIRVIEYRAISKGRKLLYEAIFPYSYIILFWWYVLNSYNSYLSGYTAGLIFFAAKSP